LKCAVTQRYSSAAVLRFLRSRWAFAILIVLAAVAWAMFGPGDSVTGQPSPNPYR
jgi:hypothetical protein